jgi:hypothetical protein
MGRGEWERSFEDGRERARGVLTAAIAAAEDYSDHAVTGTSQRESAGKASPKNEPPSSLPQALLGTIWPLHPVLRIALLSVALLIALTFASLAVMTDAQKERLERWLFQSQPGTSSGFPPATETTLISSSTDQTSSRTTETSVGLDPEPKDPTATPIRTPTSPILWRPGEIIKVQFMDGDPRLINRVKLYIQEWSEHGNVSFAFVRKDADVRVSFKGSSPRAWLGTTSRSAPAGEPTVILAPVNNDSTEQEVRSIVLHEFGHVLGLLPEQENPNAKIQWNAELLSRELDGRQPFQSSPLYEAAEYHAFDPDSIMIEPFPARWADNTLNGERRTTLSESDKVFVRRLYPF